MPALTVVITGNAKQLEAEMAKINAFAARTGQNIRTSLSQGIKPPGAPHGGGEGAGMIPSSGASREFIVLLREMARGNWSRAPGSLSILLSRLNMIHVLLNPLTIGLAAFGTVLFGIDKMFKALAPKEDTLGVKSLSRAFDRFQQSAMQSKIALQTWIDEVKRGKTEIEKLQAAMADSKNTTDAWAQSDERKAESEKDLKLAQLDHDKATGKITAEQFQKQKADVENKFEEDRFKRQKETRDKNLHEMYETANKAQAAEAKASGELSGKAEAAARAQTLRDENQARMDTLKETIKDLEKKHSEAKNGQERLMAGDELRRNRGLYDLAASKMPGLEVEAKRAQSDFQRGQQDAAGLKKQADSLREQASAQMVRNRAQEEADKAKLENDKKIRALQEPGRSHGVSHGTVSNLQRIGGYISPMTSNIADNVRKSEVHLRDIKKGIDTLCRGSMGGVRH